MKKVFINLRSFAFMVIAMLPFLGAQAQYELEWNYDYTVRNDGNLEIVGTGIDDANNYYVVSNYFDTVDVDLGPGVTQFSGSNQTSMFVAKYNSSGGLIWGKKLGINDANVIGRNMTVDAAGNIYIVGVSGTEPGVSIDFDPGPNTVNLALGTSAYRFMWVLKWDTDGNFSWVKDIRTETSTNNTGVLAHGIDVDSDGNVYVTGAWDRDLNFGPPSNFSMTSGDFKVSSFLAKYNASGTFQWAKKFEQSWAFPEFLTGIFRELSVHSSGIYVSGWFGGNIDFNPGAGFDTLSVPAQQPTCFVLKLNLSGDYLWANKFLGTTPFSRSYAYDIKTDQSGNLYFTGPYAGTVDFDPTSGTNELTAMNIDSDVMVGKINSNGNMSWVKTFGGALPDDANSVSLDDLGNVYVSGYFSDTVDFDPGTGIEELISEAFYDSYLLKLDNNGEFDWARSWGGNGYDYVWTMDFDPEGNILISGNYTSTDMEYDPFRGGFVASWTYLMKLSEPGMSVNETENNQDFSVFPVPANQFFTISGIPEDALIRLVDINGKLVIEQKAQTDIVQISTDGLVNGMYVLKIESANFKGQKKIVIN
ncbi:MAG: SBBP repeat-containing protein [Flavobacteriales bacterium]|nr:SBBP repeat-containing protein [Flavobacteriales bacterium]